MATESIGTWCHRGTLHVANNGTPETDVDATPRQITAPTFSKAGETGLTVDTTNDYITIAEAGDYMVTATLSFTGANGKTINVEIYKNTSGTGFDLERTMSSANAGSAACSGIVTCVAGDDISLYQYADSATVMTVKSMQLSVVRLS